MPSKQSLRLEIHWKDSPIQKGFYGFVLFLLRIITLRFSSRTVICKIMAPNSNIQSSAFGGIDEQIYAGHVDKTSQDWRLSHQLQNVLFSSHTSHCIILTKQKQFACHVRVAPSALVHRSRNESKMRSLLRLDRKSFLKNILCECLLG